MEEIWIRIKFRIVWWILATNFLRYITFRHSWRLEHFVVICRDFSSLVLSFYSYLLMEFLFSIQKKNKKKTLTVKFGDGPWCMEE